MKIDADLQQAIDAANNADLFNIPASVWREMWSKLRTKDGCMHGVGYWQGVFHTCDHNDPDFEYRALLSGIAITVGYGTLRG